MSNLSTYKKDLSLLIKKGEGLLKNIDKNFDYFKKQYEIWYSEAESLIKILLPGRHSDFISYYENKKQDGIKKILIF